MKTSVFLLLLSAPALAKDVASILESTCLKCHHPKNRKGGLDLSTREALFKGGDSGPAVVVGRAKESLLVRLVEHRDEPFMPQKAARLPAGAVAALAAWIDAGARYDRTLVSTAPVEVHWSFRPLRRPAGASIDAFLKPLPEAGRRTLIRRLAFDLHGLPPSPEEIESFERDAARDAVERLVDRLLASPRYGERWARHWLDVARYADSEGYRFDADRKNAWPYRDFVIRALNENLPYDVFVRWQLAGDELAPGDPLAAAATGFCTAGPVQEKQASDSKRNQERNRYDELDDVVSTVGSAMLGLTIGCARCHDHKFDPLTARDYYGLVAAFIGTKRVEVPLVDAAAAAEFKLLDATFRKRLDPVQAALRAFRDEAKGPHFRKRVEALKIRPEDREILLATADKSNQRQQELLSIHQKALAVPDKEIRESLDDGRRAEWDRLAAAVKEVEKARPAPLPLALALTDEGPKPAKNWVLDRGQVEAKSEERPLGFIATLTRTAPAPAPPKGAKTTYQRAALAAWITDVEGGAGGLLARVMANRLWHHHFGEGIVATPSDFGAQGERPSNPELLEWLASELVAKKWDLKAMHRSIVLSAAYRGARRPQRIEAEALRDAVLAVSGRLNLEMYGPGVKLPIPAELIITRTEGDNHYPREVADGPAVWRRSVYAFLKRSVPNPMTEMFDAPPTSASCGKRICTTVAPQALLLLNEPFLRARAKDFAARVQAEAPDRAVERAFLLALGRTPTATERSASEAFLKDRPLVDFCHVLFTLNEFVYVD